MPVMTNPKKFRAVIDGNPIYFDLVDLVGVVPRVLDAGQWQKVAEFLRNGNEPDRYTGLEDECGVAVYENDIVEVRNVDLDHEAMRKRDGEDDDKWDYENVIRRLHRIDVVTLEKFGFWLKNEKFGPEGDELDYATLCRVIGNTHTTPELLREGESE